MFRNFDCKKLSLVLGFLLLASFGAGRLYYKLTDDFRLANISSSLPYKKEWEVPPLNPAEKTKIDSILNQSYTYIGKGVQSYAFSSQDGQYVLKFFKFKHLKPTLMMKWLPHWGPFDKYRLEKIRKKAAKFDNVFGGYHLAYLRHRPESGLIYLHINSTHDSFPYVTVIDKVGRKHMINLNQVPFILQIKAKTMRAVLHEALEQKDIELAKARISEILDLYYAEYQKGLYDHDHGIMHNAGFAGEFPIHLDVGKLKSDENMKTQFYYSQDMALVARRMAKWLKAKESQDYSELAAFIEEKVSTLTQKPFKI